MPTDVSAALDLRLNHGLTYEEIGKIQGVAKQTIHAALKPLLPNTDETESFLEHRADILATAQIKMLKAWNDMTPGEQKELVKRRGMVDYGILQDKEFQARGLSDSNTKPMVVIQIKGDVQSVQCQTVDNPVHK